MEASKVDVFMMTNSKFFDSNQLAAIRELLLNTSDEKWGALQTLSFNDPTTSLIVSLVGGNLGIDRFIIGDTGLGIAKLLTCGGAGIWTVIDWFMIMGATREKNYEKIMTALA